MNDESSIPRVSWTLYKEATSRGISFCFYTNHQGNEDDTFRAEITNVSKGFPNIKCFDIDWQDVRSNTTFTRHNRRDIFLVINGKETLRRSNPDLEQKVFLFRYASSKTEPLSHKKALKKSKSHTSVDDETQSNSAKVNKTSSSKTEGRTPLLSYPQQKYLYKRDSLKKTRKSTIQRNQGEKGDPSTLAKNHPTMSSFSFDDKPRRRSSLKSGSSFQTAEKAEVNTPLRTSSSQCQSTPLFLKKTHKRTNETSNSSTSSFSSKSDK